MSDTSTVTPLTATGEKNVDKPMEPSPSEATKEPENKSTKNADETGDSLEKLLSHISNLQQENKELEEAMRHVREGNIAKLRSSIEEKVQPWIDSLSIPDEHKRAFISGVERACQNGGTKTMSDFEDNQVFTVVCAAAAAHGVAIQDLETTRAKLQEVEENHKKNFDEHDRRIANKTEALLYNRDSGVRPSKRARDESDAGTNEAPSAGGNLWDDMFTNLRTTNGKF
jgi:molecular chaperone GrpE (heat shock protein)